MIGTNKNCSYDSINSSQRPEEFAILGTIEKWIEKLRSNSKSEREQAAVELLRHATVPMLIAVMNLLQTDISSHTQAICIDILEKHGATISLKDVRQDDWFKEVEAEADNFHLVSRIVGKRFLAYSILLGLQIQSLKKDIEQPAGTMVQFTTDTDMVQVLPLSQFSLQVTNALLSIGIHSIKKCNPPLTESQAQKIIGELPLLVAPLFEISLKRLIVVQNDDDFHAAVGLVTPSGATYLSLGDFHEIIVRLIQSDLQKLGQENLILDFSIESAQSAFEKKEYSNVISLLETWPALLSTLQRSPAKNDLTEEQLRQIAEGTKMLGDSYMFENKTLWAIETYRIGIRYVGDTHHAGPLYLALGQLCNNGERFGEAIGYLRRAVVLLSDNSNAYNELGHALFHRQKRIGAYLSLKKAEAVGALTETTQTELLQIQKTMKEKQISWSN